MSIKGRFLEFVCLEAVIWGAACSNESAHILTMKRCVMRAITAILTIANPVLSSFLPLKS